MKERPILFKQEMVRAILDGRKTQTRRVMKPQPSGKTDAGFIEWLKDCPYGQPGDRLYVKESFWVVERAYHGSGCQFIIFEDEWDGKYPNEYAPLRPTVGLKFGHHPSIHLPKAASRITLEIVRVRVERLLEISVEDAKAEGYGPEYAGFGGDASARGSFLRGKWAEEKISKFGNPWVWVIEFRRV